MILDKSALEVLGQPGAGASPARHAAHTPTLLAQRASVVDYMRALASLRPLVLFHGSLSALLNATLCALCTAGCTETYP